MIKTINFPIVMVIHSQDNASYASRIMNLFDRYVVIEVSEQV